MRKLITATILALSATWAHAGPCSTTDMFAFTGLLSGEHAVACSGPNNMGHGGNDKAEYVLPILNNGLYFPASEFDGTWAYVGKTEDDDAFFNDPNGALGLLFPLQPQTGIFAISLKASNAFSLYVFDLAFDESSAISYFTIGTATNRFGIPQGLSHASLWSFTEDDGGGFGGGICETNPSDPSCNENSVPEPGGLALAGLGLLAAGFVTRRRKV